MKPALHFVGFRGDEWWSAVKIFGKPDFIHPKWDSRARREIAEGDVLVFATGDFDQPVAKHNATDYIEVES